MPFHGKVFAGPGGQIVGRFVGVLSKQLVFSAALDYWWRPAAAGEVAFPAIRLLRDFDFAARSCLSGDNLPGGHANLGDLSDCGVADGFAFGAGGKIRSAVNHADVLSRLNDLWRQELIAT